MSRPVATRRQRVVYVVDDDPSFLPAVVRRLEAENLDVVPFDSAQAFLDASHDEQGCCVVDLHMPGMDGLALQRAICALPKPLPIVFLTGEGDVVRSVQAMKRGAVDFLQKPVRGEELVAAVQAALDRAHQAYLRRRQVDEARRRFLTLTAREREVFARVVRGMLNKEIAWQLGTAERTVKAHRQRVMQKTGADSLADLVRLAHVLDGTDLEMPHGPSTAADRSRVRD